MKIRTLKTVWLGRDTHETGVVIEVDDDTGDILVGNGSAKEVTDEEITAADEKAERQVTINVAVAGMDQDDESLWTKAGLPRADVVDELTGLDTTAEERQIAFDAIPAE